MYLAGINFIKRAINKVDPTMAKIFMPWIMKHPGSIPTMLKLAKSYKKSRRVRNEELFKNNLKVPPFLILSITSSCNLRCTGCYAAATGTLCSNKIRENLNYEQWGKIIKDACQLGVFAFIIAGGEPFIMPNLLKLIEDFKDRLFIIFTNGTLIEDKELNELKHLKNIIIVVSIEGNKEMTDLRRGDGVYEKVITTLQRLDSNGIISGISATITRKNAQFWMDSDNIEKLIIDGVKIGFLLEYIPVDEDIELMLTAEERIKFREKVLSYRRSKDIFLVHSPGDEEYFGGCVSAGRGFAHVTPSGELTPCPVSNIATHNLKKSSLREGLNSELFKIIRQNEHLLETEGSPCALFSHPNEVNELVKKVKAYRTSV